MGRQPAVLAVASGYPSERFPHSGAFVHVLMRDMLREGARPTVLAPEKIVSLSTWRRGLGLAPSTETRDGVEIRRPRYLPLSNKLLPGGLSTYWWTVASFARAVTRDGGSVSPPPDLCYGHFLYPAGLAASRLARRLGVPAVVALGESAFDSYERHFGVERVRAALSRFDAIIAVSQTIRDRCVQRYGVPEGRVAVFPNGVDHDVFFPKDRVLARQGLGLPQDRPMVAFVGHFVERKGPLRVLEAIKSRPEIAAVFLGTGPMIPAGPQVLFSGVVPHDQVSNWLNAADVFVLPTLAEGSSNAVLEAMSCGIPVVTSDRPFNEGIVDESVGIPVEPADVPAIGAAIASLVDDAAKRKAMGLAALARAEGFRSRDRARRILDWLALICL